MLTDNFLLGPPVRFSNAWLNRVILMQDPDNNRSVGIVEEAGEIFIRLLQVRFCFFLPGYIDDLIFPQHPVRNLTVQRTAPRIPSR